MATINLLLGRTAFRTTVGALHLDAASEITHAGAANATKNPIEAGSDVTDNVRVQNRRLTISGIISQTPFSFLRSSLGGLTGIGATVGETAFGQFASIAFAAGLGSLAGVIADRNEEDKLYPKKAFDYLFELMENRIPFNVQTRLKVYEDMIITSLTVPEDSKLGDSIKFVMALERINLVNTEVIIVPEAVTKKRAGATAKQNTGKKPKNEATERQSSLAFKGLEKIKGLF